MLFDKFQFLIITHCKVWEKHYLSLLLLDFDFLYFFYTSNHMTTLFYNLTKTFDKVFKSLNFWFLLSFHIFESLKLIFELINPLEIKTSMPFILDFVNNTILSCFFFFFLITDLYYLISATITIFDPIAEVVISIGSPNIAARPEFEIYLIILEAKI